MCLLIDFCAAPRVSPRPKDDVVREEHILEFPEEAVEMVPLVHAPARQRHLRPGREDEPLRSQQARAVFVLGVRRHEDVEGRKRRRQIIKVGKSHLPRQEDRHPRRRGGAVLRRADVRVAGGRVLAHGWRCIRRCAGGRGLQRPQRRQQPHLPGPHACHMLPRAAVRILAAARAAHPHCVWAHSPGPRSMLASVLDDRPLAAGFPQRSGSPGSRTPRRLPQRMASVSIH